MTGEKPERADVAAERVWERTMADLCGEDGPASVVRVVTRLAVAAADLADTWDPARPWTKEENALLNALLPFRPRRSSGRGA